jgi:sterol desaturase/sphingolipid hydroxylase (fatty acid hydroxylase superfamily)
MVHHSVDQKYSDTNFAQIFVWDKLFGTYTDPASVPENEPSGLNYENTNLRLLFGFPPPKSDSVKIVSSKNESANVFVLVDD